MELAVTTSVKGHRTFTQRERILSWMRQRGSISAVEAMTELGCFRLAARIKELRDTGYEIETELEEHSGGSHARYRLVPEDQQRSFFPDRF